MSRSKFGNPTSIQRNFRFLVSLPVSIQIREKADLLEVELTNNTDLYLFVKELQIEGQKALGPPTSRFSDGVHKFRNPKEVCQLIFPGIPFQDTYATKISFFTRQAGFGSCNLGLSNNPTQLVSLYVSDYPRVVALQARFTVELVLQARAQVAGVLDIRYPHFLNVGPDKRLKLCLKEGIPHVCQLLLCPVDAGVYDLSQGLSFGVGDTKYQLEGSYEIMVDDNPTVAEPPKDCPPPAASVI